jgi:hypothetical protein
LLFAAGRVNVMVPGAGTPPAKENDAMAATTNRENNPALAEVMERTRRLLNLDTLETRDRDSLDFWPVHVATIRQIVRDAFEAGFLAGAESK